SLRSRCRRALTGSVVPAAGGAASASLRSRRRGFRIAALAVSPCAHRLGGSGRRRRGFRIAALAVSPCAHRLGGSRI
ncbi:hypothetical protein, partial [Mycolicibacterium llatzerense]|uniref:hypothetical protein n=1 Tax=Mycolicibacterium llatzerense TaxID=280871 RepID=UPI0019550965